MAFLPVTKKEMEERGWEQPDFVFVTGDAYVDHPSFGHAIISRVLEGHGYRVAMLSQPDWRTAEDFKRFGKPRLGFLINSGNVDSMVNHYSVFKHHRKKDIYSPGGEVGHRPDRALIVYCNRVREAYKDVPIIIGGLEASLRRFTHYDYWDDGLRRSILMDSGADLMTYGMGERATVAVAEALESGIPVEEITWIPGTVYRKKLLLEEGKTEKEAAEEIDPEIVLLPSFEEQAASSEVYGKAFALQYRNNDAITGKTMLEYCGGGKESRIAIVQNPPAEPLDTLELDDVYELPYEGTYHPMYRKLGGVPAIEEVQYSIVANRGCFGGCAFCALAYHQGREVRGRSKESILREAERITKLPGFKGYIHDVGGPTANFHSPACEKQKTHGVCRDRDCLYPTPCKNMKVDHTEYLDILRAVRELPGVKKVFVRSGIRFDYVMADKDSTFLEELCRYHISGTLKVAPEHISSPVLRCMRKPGIGVFRRFSARYAEMNRKLGKKQYLIPYLISSHPGATLEDAVQVALFLKETGFVPDQVQDFYPTPGTLSTCMYYTGKDPLTGDLVHVPKDLKEKQMQRALLHFHKPENRKLVLEALRLTGHAPEELFGNGERIPSRQSVENRSYRGKTGRKKGRRG